MNAAPIQKTQTGIGQREPQSLSHDMQCTLWIDEQGYIEDGIGKVAEMFGYRLDELAGQSIFSLLPGLGDFELVSRNRINPILHHRCHCMIPFRGRHKDGHEMKCYLYLNLLSSPSGRRLTVTIQNHSS